MCNPEAAFVALCTREPDVIRDGEIEMVAAQVQDWGEVVELAGRHRALAYVRQALTRTGIRISSEAERELGKKLLAVGMQAVVLQSFLRRIAPLFEAANVPMLVLKGPVLGPLLYPAATFRPSADLDIEVRPEDVDRAALLLEANGLVERAYGAEVARREHAGHVHGSSEFHRVFYSQDNKIVVELHVDALQMGVRFAPEQGRWERAVAVSDLPGVLMLSAADQLVHLSVHAQKHGFNRLIWLKDLDLLLRWGAAADWDRAVEIARAEGVQASVWYALTLLNFLLGTPLPEQLLRRLQPSVCMRAIYRRVWPTREIIALQGHMRRRAVQFHVADSWRGMLPSLVLMGHRRQRLRAIADAVFG